MLQINQKQRCGVFLFYFIGVQLLCNVVLFSAVQQSKSAIHIHISPFEGTSFLFRSPQGTEQISLCYTVSSHQLFMQYINSIYMPSQSSSSSPPPSPLVSTCLFSICLIENKHVLYRQVHLYHFSRFHIYALIYNICFSLLTYFTLYYSL